MTINTATSLCDEALSFARRGWAVFPCNPRDKRPLLKSDVDGDGKKIRGSGGVTKATTDKDQIRAWWTKWPQAMIGVAAGPSGLLIVDYDPRTDTEIDGETGEVLSSKTWTVAELRALVATQIGCALPATLTVRTPSGGEHDYFRMPAGEPIGNVGSLPRHVDVRGAGGYVIVPPSVCKGGPEGVTPGPYLWIGDPDAPIAAMPEALAAVLRTPKVPERRTPATPAASYAVSDAFPVDVDERTRRYVMGALDRVVEELRATPQGGGRHGGRNKGAFQAAFNMGGFIGAGAISAAVVRAALGEVMRAFDPAGYERNLQTIDNGIEAGRQRPHDLSGIQQTARRRDSGGSASPLPPVEAYADDAARFHGQPAPGPDWGEDGEEPFHSEATAPDAPARGGGGRIAPPRDEATDRRCAQLALTDLGNAERFFVRCGWRFRFCPELGWFAWDGRRWELLSEEKDKVPGRVSLAVFETVRAIRNEAEAVAASGLQEEAPAGASDEELAQRLDFIATWKGSGDNKIPVLYSELLALHAKSSEGASRLGCIANLVKSFDAIAIASDAMDADRMAINVLNGTLRLTQEGKRWADVDGVLKPITMGDRWGLVISRHRPEDLISKVAHVTFDPAAKAGVYDGFLEVVQPDPVMRRFLHQWGGLSLTGDIAEQKLAFFHGKGRNGKSTLVDLWSHLAGDYGGSVAIETFLDQGKGRKGGEATPDLARLPGIRFLRTSEPEKGAKLAEALIKLITGGEPIDARHLNKGFFTFLPSFKVTVSGNHKPKITGHDDGIWRRVMLVPWDVQIAAEDVDKRLPEKLRAEAGGVLNRLLIGLLDWRQAGLVEPEIVIAATAKYREQSDQLGRFLSECTEPIETARSKSSELFALFTAWAKANGAAEWQQVGFTKAMEDRGFENKRSNGIQWLGIEMTKSPSDFADNARGHDPGPEPDDYPPL